MQIQVQRLREALQLLGPVVPSKTTLPVLANILLKDGQALATDLEVAVALELPEAEGQCVLPLRPVAEVLKRVPWHETLTLEQEGKSLHLAWSGGKASYSAPNPEDYPPFPKVEARAEQAVDGDTLVPALLSVVEYCTSEKARPVLTGVILFLGDTIEVAAGDGFRMAYQTLPVSFPAEGIDSVIIPASAIRALGHLWQGTPRVVPLESSLIAVVTAKRWLELALAEKMLEARFGRVSLTAHLIQGDPPNFKKLIPEDTPLKVQAFGPDLERAVRQVREVAKDAKDAKGTVRLSWSEVALTVSAKSEEKGEVEATVPVESQGGPGRVALNVSYLLDYLRGREGIVTMGVSDEKAPVLFRHGASPQVLVMPMFVQW